MLESIETRGIVLYNREFREEDKLVKIFTEKSGKRMFFVKHAGKSRLNPMLQPLVTADMLLKINDDGLSYIDDFQDVQVYKKSMQIFLPFLMRPMFWRLQMQVFRIIKWIRPCLLFWKRPCL